MSTILPIACNPFNEEEDQDEFYHHREARTLSEQEYNKYFGKDKVETSIIDDDCYDTDDESESEDEQELFQKMVKKTKDKIKEKNRKKKMMEMRKEQILQHKLDRIAFINQLVDEDI